MPRTSRLHFSAVVATLTLCLVSVGSAQSTYTITDLGTLGGNYGFGQGINSSGQVAGYDSLTSNGPTHPFVISSPYTSMIDLGTLLSSGGGGFSQAFGINSTGQVTGQAPTDNSSGHAFVISPPYSAGTMIDLGTLGSDYSVGYGINKSGQVTGLSYPTNSSPYQAFVISPPYSSGTMIGLGFLSGGTYSWAYGINDSGQVTGFSGTDNGGGIDSANHAFVISPPYSSGMIDLGILGDRDSFAYGINSSGQVTGGSAPPNNRGYMHAFVISPPYTNMIDIGTLDGTSSTGFGINTSGQVTGSSGPHAFLYTPAKGMVDLNTLVPSGSGWTLVAGYAINDAGQITGVGFNPNGYLHPFLLTPPPAVTTDLAIRKSGAPKIKSGKPMNYALAVANKGPSNASGVIVTDSLPNGTTFVSATPTQGSCTGTTTVTCNLGTIAAAGGASVSLVVNVTASAGSTIRNTASVTGNVTDPNTANNTSTLTTSVF